MNHPRYHHFLMASARRPLEDDDLNTVESWDFALKMSQGCWVGTSVKVGYDIYIAITLWQTNITMENHHV